MFNFLYLSSYTAVIMTDINKAIVHLISAFSKYAGRDGNAQTLSKAELSELLKNELGELLGVSEL